MDSVIPGLTVVFAVLAAVLALLGVLYSPVVFAVAVPFGLATSILWYQASGRLERRLLRSARAGRTRDEPTFGTGVDSRGATRPRDARAARAGQTAGRHGATNRRTATERTNTAWSAQETARKRRDAYRTHGLEPGANEAEVKRAYRERVKAVHPDRGGDAEAFKRVQAAYERLDQNHG